LGYLVKISLVSLVSLVSYCLTHISLVSPWSSQRRMPLIAVAAAIDAAAMAFAVTNPTAATVDSAAMVAALTLILTAATATEAEADVVADATTMPKPEADVVAVVAAPALAV
jgi:hypothetical protein